MHTSRSGRGLGGKAIRAASPLRALVGWAACLAALATGIAAGAEMTPLTSGPGNDTEAAWSPDGRRIAFQSDRRGTLGLYVLDLASHDLRPLVEGPGHASFPAWSPDGKWIVYTYAHFTKTALEGQDDGHNLFVVPAEGGTPRRLTQGRCRDYSAAFLPDGKTIWFSSDRENKGKSNAVSLWSVDLAGGKPQPVVRLDRGDWALVQTSFSPDGRSFACGAISGFRDNWRIRLARADSPQGSYGLTDPCDSFYAPRWSPTGTLLACTGFTLGDPGWGVWLLDARTGRRLRVETGPGNSRSPAWSPDGRRLVLENNRSGSYKLYAIDAPGLSADAPASPATSTDKLVLHCDFAQRPGPTVNDLGPLANHARVQGTLAWRPKAIRLDSPDASLVIAKPKGFEFGAGPFSVRAVVQVPEGVQVVSESPSGHGQVSKPNKKEKESPTGAAAAPKIAMIAMGEYPGNRLGWQLFLGEDGRACFNSRTTTLQYRGARSDEPLPRGRAVTLTGLRDAAGRVQLYVDGALQQTTASEALYEYGAPVQVRIGTQYNGTAPFPGWIHDVAVFGRALSREEARADSLRWFWIWAAPSESPQAPVK